MKRGSTISAVEGELAAASKGKRKEGAAHQDEEKKGRTQTLSPVKKPPGWVGLLRKNMFSSEEERESP